MKDAGIFLGRKKRMEGIFWVGKKELKEFLGYAKKRRDFFGYKIWTSCQTPPPPLPPSLKFVSGAPGPDPNLETYPDPRYRVKHFLGFI